MNSGIDKEANTLKFSIGYAENFSETGEITGISEKMGHSDSCLAFSIFLKIQPEEYINQVLKRRALGKEIDILDVSLFL